LTDKAINLFKTRGCYTFEHNPILEARHWAITDGKDVEAGGYHRTHSAYAIASFHEALRLLLDHGLKQKAADYAACEKVLSAAVSAMGCDVTSNMTSLVVLNLPGDLAGREKELVGGCRAEGFGIWPTLSEPVQVRIGILNQLTKEAVLDIIGRFATAMQKMGAEFDKAAILADAESKLS
jgi:aspartate aminotransferase-like enzyme